MYMSRPEVTAAIEMHSEHGTKGFENVGPTVNFMKKIHKWISLHDVSSLKEYYFKRLFDKKTFSKADDERLSFLEYEIPERLKKWEEEVL